MRSVDVYFYNQKIYNLEDLSILGTFSKNDRFELDKKLKSIKEEYEINLAMINFNSLLRDSLYGVFPKAKVMIHPFASIKMVESYLGPRIIGGSTNQEIAAGVEDHGLVMSKVELGCLGIYTKSTKEEAKTYYKMWQGDVPIGIDCFYKVISIIDYYDEEVFNYFDFKLILNKTILIR